MSERERRAPRRVDVLCCSRCKRSLPSSASRLIIGGSYVCGDCAYIAEHGPAPKRSMTRPHAGEQLELAG